LLSNLNHINYIFCLSKIRISYLLIFLAFTNCSYLCAQIKNENELKKEAEKLFEAEDYNSAYKLFAQLVSLYPKDPNYNYKLGVCMLFTEPDKKKPYSYLQIAANSKTDAPKDAKFYLAKTYHVNYKFDEAIKLYNEYKQIGSAASIKKFQVDREIQACKNGKRLLSNFTELIVMTKKLLNEADYFKAYDIKDIGGKLLVKPDDYKSTYDKKKKDKSVVYLPKTNDRLYYSSYGEDGNRGRDIYMLDKLSDGTWSKAQILPNTINSEYDEDYPFLHPNGKTLYFSSKGHNSMGGYDIFKTTYDESTQSWSLPINLEFPINSPDDDILFVTDSLEKTAFFSTGRNSPVGKLDVLKINTERVPMNFAVLKGSVLKEEASQSLKSKVTVKNMSNGEIVGTFQAQENGDYNMQLPNGGKFIFTVETPRIETQSSEVQIPVAYSLKPYKQVISYDNKILKIINYFDGAIDDESYTMMLDLIEKKAKLEVNENDPAIVSALKDDLKNNAATADPDKNLNSVSTSNPSIVGDKSNAAVQNKNINATNEQLLAIAKLDAIEATDEAKKLKQEAIDAFGLATQKNAEAIEKQKQADQALEIASNIVDVAKKNEEFTKVSLLQDEAKTATTLSNIATNIAKKLEVDAAIQQKEADLTNQYINQLGVIIKNKNNKEALEKLENIQKELDDLSKQKNQSDELYSSLKAESELKKQELQSSDNKNKNIATEITALKNESESLENDFANESDKSIKENISAQIRELKIEIDSKNNDLATNNQKIENLKSEVQGLSQELQIAAKILNEKTDEFAINNEFGNTGIESKQNINTDKSIANASNSNAITNQSNSSAPNLTYQEVLKTYNSKINSKIIDSNNPEEISNKNDILMSYNRDINSLLAIDQNAIAKAKNSGEKKALSDEIKNLEKIKSENEKSIISNNEIIKQLTANALADNVSNAQNSASLTVNSNNLNKNADGNAIINDNDSNKLAALNNINNSSESKTADNQTPTSSGTKNSSEVLKSINLSAANNKNAFLDELNKLKKELASNADIALQVFNYNPYLENSSSVLKKVADQKYQDTKLKEQNLNNLIAKTETAINISSVASSEELITQAEKLSNTAFEQRRESATKSGAEKDVLVKQAIENEKLATIKKIEAATIAQKENKAQFEINTSNLTELQKLTGSKTSDEISQANMLFDEAAINFKQAQNMRAEAESYPSGAAKLGGLSNAEEKENEALTKQQKAITALLKTNTNYQLKQLDKGDNPSEAIAILNNEILKIAQAQLDACLALSKTNQNEFKLQNDKLIKNQAFKNSNYNQLRDLKTKADNLNSEAKAFIGQSLIAKTTSEKADLLLKANQKEIEAIKTLAESTNLMLEKIDVVAANKTEVNTASKNSSNQETEGTTNNEKQSGNQENPENIEKETGVITNSLTTNNEDQTKEKADVGKVEKENGTITNTVVANNENQNKENSETLSVLASESSTINSISDEVVKLKNNLKSNSKVADLVKFNNYKTSDAISLKNNADDKINTALNEDKQIELALENISELAAKTETSSNLDQNTISSILLEADKLIEDAAAYRKSATTKTGAEKEEEINKAKSAEIEASTKKIDAASKQQQLNSATYEANKQSLQELAEMAKGKNISTLSTADMVMNEAQQFFNQSQKIREEADSYPNNAAKLGGYSNAEEKEFQALFKQQALLDSYKKEFPNYVPKKASVASENNEVLSKLNETKVSLNNNNQLYIDGLNLLVQANEKEYKNRFMALSENIIPEQLNLKKQAQKNYKNNQEILSRANQSSDLAAKTNLLIEATKSGQEAINLLNQITDSNAVSKNSLSLADANTNNTNENNKASENENLKNKDNLNAVSTNTTAAVSVIKNATETATTTTTTKIITATTTANSNNVTDAVNPSNEKANVPVVNIKVEGLEVKNTNAYSANNPIPIDEKLPDGLVFKVQIGAFKAPLPNNTFKGLTPVIAQTTPSGYIRYMAGNFKQYTSANAVKNDLRNLGYSDAFVVAYLDGKRINLNEATDKAKTAGQTIDVTSNESAGLTGNANVPKNTTVISNNTTAINNNADNQLIEITNELERMNGLLFTVQIGVYSKQATRGQLFNLKPIYTEKLPNGLYRYTAGIYNQANKLLDDKRKVVDLGVKDAFVSAYFNSKRIAFAEGQKLQLENSNLKLEVENPIIFNGTDNGKSTTPTSVTANNNQPVSSIPSATAFTNGVSVGPNPTAENGVKLDDAGISYKVQIGAYKNQIPNDVANKFLNIKTWPVKNVAINNLYIYTIGGFNAFVFAKKLKDEAVSVGITDAFITVYKDGKKLYGSEAAQYLSQ